MLSRIRSPHPNSHRRPSRSLRSLVLACVSLVTIGLFATPAQALSSVPRLIPSRVPASYQVEEAFDRTEPENGTVWAAYLRNETNDRAIATFADAVSAKLQKELVKDLVGRKLKRVVVRKQKAFVDQQGNQQVLYWFEKGRAFTSYAVNVELKTQVAAANGAIPTKTSPSSFVINSVPAGFVSIYNGLNASLRGSYSRIIYVEDPDNKHSHLIVEVTSVNRAYIDIYLLSPFVDDKRPITINGKAGYEYSTGSFTSMWWEEQPGLLVEVTSADLSHDALVDVAASVAPSDETTWKALVTQADNFGSSAGVTPTVDTKGLVGAGMVEGEPWTAQLSAQPNCLVFGIGGSTSESCVKSPNALGWSAITVKTKNIAVGVAAANVTTVVVRVNGAEVSRAQVGIVSGQPLYRLFVVALPAGAVNATIAGLDAAGTEVQSAIGPRL